MRRTIAGKIAKAQATSPKRVVRHNTGNAAWQALSDKPRCRPELLMANPDFQGRVSAAWLEYSTAMREAWRALREKHGAAVAQVVREMESKRQ